MSCRIKILPEPLINQIAAGEVIERPASVVKELVENSIDAQSSDITVDLIHAGKTKISVRDNGIGMTREELSICIERYATSKINSLEDIFKVKTLGFRGEALPSIASVSKLKLTSRQKNSHEAYSMMSEGGKRGMILVTGAPVGTEVMVGDLFFNIPARLKFLKSNSTELSRVSELISELAIANPKISFRFTHQGRKVYHALSTPSLLERILSLWGGKSAAFLSMDESFEEWRLYGYAGIPSLTSPTLRHCFTYVNGRPIRDKTLIHAISSAYQDVIPHGLYPKIVLFLESPSHAVDVNTHPTKREIRFQNPHFVHGLVERGIKRVLQRQTKVAGISSFEMNTMGDINQRDSTPRSFTKMGEYFSTGNSMGIQNQVFIRDSENGVPSSLTFGYSNLHYIGQLKSSYLIFEDNHNLIFIDQHAAHERVMFERLKKEFQQSHLRSQYLLVPLSLELTTEEVMIIEEHAKELQKLGFEIEHFGGKTFVVKSVPQHLFDENNPQSISAQTVRAMLAELSVLPKTVLGEELLDHYLSTMACHSARTAKEKLELEEVTALLKSLDDLNSAPHCPHGRPFSFSIPIESIEKKFHR